MNDMSCAQCEPIEADRKMYKHEEINKSIEELMYLSTKIIKLKLKITTSSDKEQELSKVEKAICIEKPLASTLIEAPKQIREIIKNISENIDFIEKSLF